MLELARAQQEYLMSPVLRRMKSCRARLSCSTSWELLYCLAGGTSWDSHTAVACSQKYVDI